MLIHIYHPFNLINKFKNTHTYLKSIQYDKYIKKKNQ